MITKQQQASTPDTPEPTPLPTETPAPTTPAPTVKPTPVDTPIANKATAYGDALTDGLAPKTLPFPSIPGLADLKKPLFVTKGSYVCDSLESLAAINQAIYNTAHNINNQGFNQGLVNTLLELRMCVSVPEDVFVVAIPPADQGDYLQEVMMRYTVVMWENSNGTSYSGYVSIARLRNGGQ